MSFAQPMSSFTFASTLSWEADDVTQPLPASCKAIPDAIRKAAEKEVSMLQTEPPSFPCSASKVGACNHELYIYIYFHMHMVWGGSSQLSPFS